MNDRREFLKTTALAGLGALAGTGKTMGFELLTDKPGQSALDNTQLDKLQQRAVNELTDFTEWLTRNNARGFIGELGFPRERNKIDKDNCKGIPEDITDNYRKWNDLAEIWYQKADAAKLWATIWATGEWWGDYTLAVYKKSPANPGSINAPNTQAQVFERHPSTPDYERGITVAGGEFGTKSGTEETQAFSNKNPGLYDEAYHYDTQETFNYLASRGVTLVRIPFRWERIQPQLGRNLDSRELGRLKAVVERARRSRADSPQKMKVILDLHNFGAYYEAPNSRTNGRRRDFRERNFGRYLVDVWQRLSSQFRAVPDVYYGLMCEPVDAQTGATPSAATSAWELASQQIVDKIRSAGDNKLIIVSGYYWSGVKNWNSQHRRGWITDRQNNFLYEAHHYWDSDSSGHYCLSYDDELSRLR